MRVVEHSVRWRETAAAKIFTYQGLTTCTEVDKSWTIMRSAYSHLRQGGKKDASELGTLIRAEVEQQECFEAMGYRSPTWRLLRALQSPFLGRARLHTTQSPCVRIIRSHSSRPSSHRPSHKKTVGPCSLPQNLVVPLPALGRKGGAVTPPTLLAAVLPKAGIVELVAASTLEIDIPSLQGAPVALLLLG